MQTEQPMHVLTQRELERTGIKEGATVTPEIMAKLQKMLIDRDKQMQEYAETVLYHTKHPAIEQGKYVVGAHIGEYSVCRNYFEHDARFSLDDAHQKISTIVGSYESAAEHAALFARFATFNEARAKEAVWAEASAQTLEYVLDLFLDHEDNEPTNRLPWIHPLNRPDDDEGEG